MAQTSSGPLPFSIEPVIRESALATGEHNTKIRPQPVIFDKQPQDLGVFDGRSGKGTKQHI